jgi:hypothetical protein
MKGLRSHLDPSLRSFVSVEKAGDLPHSRLAESLLTVSTQEYSQSTLETSRKEGSLCKRPIYCKGIF